MDDKLLTAERFGQQKGFALRNYCLKCIQDGDWPAIAREFSDEKTVEAILAAMGRDKEFVFYSLLYVWAQEEHSAVLGGVSEEEASRLFFKYAGEARRAASIREMFALHLRLMRDYAEAVARENKKQGKNAPVLRAQRFVEDHLYEELTPARLAAETHFSVDHLSRLFKQYAGETVTAYIQRQRIEEAKRLLRHSTLSMADISANLCFCSQSYFASVFKKQEGVTPREYRERVQKEG